LSSYFILVRNETLSWANREFRNSGSLTDEEQGLLEIKEVMHDEIHPNDEKIIEINNINNTMNNKKKGQFMRISSTPKFNRISCSFDYRQRRTSSFSNYSPRRASISSEHSPHKGASFSNYSPLSDYSQSPTKYNPNEGILVIEEAEYPASSQKYNSYGTFSKPNDIPHLNYESLNVNQFNNNNQKLFKDNIPQIVDVNDLVKDDKAMYSYQNDNDAFSPIAPNVETNTTTANETTPLTVPHSNDNNHTKFKTYMLSWIVQFFKFLPAVLLGVLLNLLDSLSYGIIIFPKHESMPSTYVQSGISMFLFR